MKKVLITIDAGPTAEKIASAGLQLAKQLNAEIALLSIVDTQFLTTEGGVTPGQMARSIKEEIGKNVGVIESKIFGKYPVQTFLEEGNPSEVILRVAEEWQADLIVLGTHGRTGLSHILLGSVAEKVLRHSSKPLLIIPSK